MFKHGAGAANEEPHEGFNPSVGILGVQARPLDIEAADEQQFQSLGRDSGCSSTVSANTMVAAAVCFNPSVGILGVQAASVAFFIAMISLVSIPRSGFWVFKLANDRRFKRALLGFNPSVGILGVQA